jgi:hypothetical protein
MRLNDDELRELYRSTGTAPDAGPCLDADQLLRAAAGQLAPAERRRVAAHLVRCEDCSCELRLIRTLQPWAEGAAAPGPMAAAPWALQPAAALHSPAPRRWAASLALAAAVALAAGLGLLDWRRPVPLEPPAQDAPRSAALHARLEPLDGARLPEAPERLSWDHAVHAGPARVVLYDVRMLRVWESPELAQPPADLPAEVRSRLQPGRRYYWAVLSGQGSGLRRSALYRFELEP